MSNTLQSLEAATRRLAKRKAIAELTAPPIGTVFSRLTVASLPIFHEGHQRIRVTCVCGAERTVRLSSLSSGNTKSCGCIAKEEAIRKGTCGKSAYPEYNTWMHILHRCNNPKDARYSDYGGRGITIFPAWAESFDAFYEAVGPRPFEGASIDRIDTDKNYEPGNVRWATPIEQANNKRSNVKFDYRGRLCSLQELAEIAVVRKGTLISRLYEYNWSVARAVETPVMGATDHYTLGYATTTPATRHKLYPQQPTTPQP